MRIFLALSAIVTVLLFGAVFALAVEVLPYLIIGMVIAALIRQRHHRRPRTPVDPGTPVHHAIPAPPPPRTAVTGGWVFVPVWVQSLPQPTVRVIDAEFIRDPRDG